jgi:hypothetical protein
MNFTIPQYDLSLLPLDSLTRTNVAITFFLLVISVPIGRAFKTLLHNFFSPLRELPVPDGAGFVLGHLNAIRKAEGGDWHEEMLEKYGHVMRYKAFFGVISSFLKDIVHHLTNGFHGC